jgi:hypothetical protein
MVLSQFGIDALYQLHETDQAPLPLSNHMGMKDHTTDDAESDKVIGILFIAYFNAR